MTTTPRPDGASAAAPPTDTRPDRGSAAWAASTAGSAFVELGRRPGLGELATAARAAGWRVVILDGRRTATKSALLAALARSLDVPSWFGHNWDALVDALRGLADPVTGDLGSGAAPTARPPVYVIWDGADILAGRDPRAVATFAQICEDVVAEGVALRVAARGSRGRPDRPRRVQHGAVPG